MRLRGLFFATGACGPCHPAYFTILIFWEMLEHIVIYPLWVRNRWLSFVPITFLLFASSARVSFRIGHN